MNRKFAVVLAIVAIAVTSAVTGMKNPIVGGQEMYLTKNIIENAVKAAGLVETLEGPGRSPYSHPRMKHSRSSPPAPWTRFCQRTKRR